MNRASLQQETIAWMDTVDLALCLFIYEVCNDYQFEYCPGSDFMNFLNLIPTGRAVIVRPKENLRICYMVFSIARTIRSRERGKLWSEEFLKRCGISKSYYDKHCSAVCNKGTTKENQDFRKSVDKAVENARRLNSIHSNPPFPHSARYLPITAMRYTIHSQGYGAFFCMLGIEER